MQKNTGKADALRSRNSNAKLPIAMFLAAGLAAVIAIYYAMSISKTTKSVPEGQTVSIIMASHNENHYLERTLNSIMGNTPLEHIVDIIIVDDASDPPASVVLDNLKIPQLKVVRNDVREGLIRSKMIGVRASSGDILMFLDAHVRTYPGWLEPLIALTADNYRRIAVPMIPVMNETTWEQKGNFEGSKLIFDWKMDFIWYTDERDDYIPIMSGGLLAVTRKWFDEAGQYDAGMLMWGGENVEQSVKTWLCGGEIVLARASRVGHVFREVSPYVVNTTQIHVNKARAIDVWFDEWGKYYYRANPFDRKRRAGDEALASRFEIKKRLECKPFSTFVDRFMNIFQENNLIPTEVYGIRHKSSGLCITLNPDGKIVGAACNAANRAQIFIPEAWNRLRSGKFVDDCIEVKADKTLKANLCSAHENGQLNLALESAKGQLVKKPRDGKDGSVGCVHMSEAGALSMNDCDGTHVFEKVFVKPYDHSRYQ